MEYLRLWTGTCTDQGRQRDHNEDAFVVSIPSDPHQLESRGALFAVADGMGGHAAGEIASRSALETLVGVYYGAQEGPVADALVNATHAANERVIGEARRAPERRGMGTTLVAAAVRGNRLTTVNVGDCRLYLFRNGVLKQLTRDHSFVAEQVRAGLITEEEAKHHPRRNLVSRALGTGEAEPDLTETRLQSDDAFLLCTDGLYSVIADMDLLRLGQGTDPNLAARELVALANENGGPDNITALVVRVEEPLVDPNAITQVLPKVRLPR